MSNSWSSEALCKNHVINGLFLLKKSGLLVKNDLVIHCIWPEFAHSFAYFRLLELFVSWQGMDRRLWARWP